MVILANRLKKQKQLFSVEQYLEVSKHKSYPFVNGSSVDSGCEVCWQVYSKGLLQLRHTGSLLHRVEADMLAWNLKAINVAKL